MFSVVWRTDEIVPELSFVHFADLAAEQDVAPAYFVSEWPGGLALARYVLDHPELVRGLRVLDFGTGCGVVAIAAARAGAEYVCAVDRDDRAVRATLRNAERNGHAIDARAADPLRSDFAVDVDVVLAGDVIYTDAIAPEVLSWLETMARGRRVIVGDSGRAGAVSPPHFHLLWSMRPSGGPTGSVFEVDPNRAPTNEEP